MVTGGDQATAAVGQRAATSDRLGHRAPSAAGALAFPPPPPTPAPDQVADLAALRREMAELRDAVRDRSKFGPRIVRRNKKG